MDDISVEIVVKGTVVSTLPFRRKEDLCSHEMENRLTNFLDEQTVEDPTAKLVGTAHETVEVNSNKSFGRVII